MKFRIKIEIEGVDAVLTRAHEDNVACLTLLRGALGDNLRFVLTKLVDELVTKEAETLIKFVNQEEEIERLAQETNELAEKERELRVFTARLHRAKSNSKIVRASRTIK